MARKGKGGGSPRIQGGKPKVATEGRTGNPGTSNVTHTGRKSSKAAKKA